MERALLAQLTQWLKSTNRKPLIIKGARQVGKTWLVRHLANMEGKRLIELNFEKIPSLASLFASNDPQQILLNLSTLTNQKIIPEECLLFLDEIQVSPEMLSKLRWFAEDLPELPVIAAGSLLEFVLADHSFSMPVGRINFMHLEPLSFEEFLVANNKEMFYEYIKNYDLAHDIPATIHGQLLMSFKEYILIGGLPAAVQSWITERSLIKVNQIHHDLLATYRDDFYKYKGRLAVEKLDNVMMAIPKMLGQKFVYSRINSVIQSNATKQVLELLEKARICHRVSGCAANGVPLGAEIKDKYFKEIFLDVGLCSAALGLSLSQINSIHEITVINNGSIAEQIVGQLLRTITPFYIEPALYTWHREEPGTNAEVDYIIQHGNKVIPIEIKAGSTGTLKSLHLFMGMKKFQMALRINSNLPGITNINVKDHAGNPIAYKLLSLPFYLTGQIHRLLEQESNL